MDSENDLNPDELDSNQNIHENTRDNNGWGTFDNSVNDENEAVDEEIIDLKE